jgi:FKBP-type peptidyl-prolyl cis-trans isomerase FkpA
MKTGLIKVTLGFFAALPFIVTSCLMSDSEDFPDFNEQLQKDLLAIDNYLAANNIVAQQDPEGLVRYVIHIDSIGGKKPNIDSCLTVNYQGKLLDTGTEFDKGDSVSFRLNSVIDGWKIGIPLLNEGDSATLYIPSGLAYGYIGVEPEIPKNANLFFHVGIEKVGTTYNGAAGGSCD